MRESHLNLLSIEIFFQHLKDVECRGASAAGITRPNPFDQGVVVNQTATGKIGTTERVFPKAMKDLVEADDELTKEGVTRGLVDRLVEGPILGGGIANAIVGIFDGLEQLFEIGDLGGCGPGRGEGRGLRFKTAANFQRLEEGLPFGLNGDDQVPGIATDGGTEKGAAPITLLDDTEGGPGAEGLAHQWATDTQAEGDLSLWRQPVADTEARGLYIVGKLDEDTVRQPDRFDAAHGSLRTPSSRRTLTRLVDGLSSCLTTVAISVLAVNRR